jgi:hypothetical protein
MSDPENCRVYSKEPNVTLGQIVGQNAYDGTQIVMIELPRSQNEVEHVGFTMNVAMAVADKIMARCMNYQSQEAKK